MRRLLVGKRDPARRLGLRLGRLDLDRRRAGEVRAEPDLAPNGLDDGRIAFEVTSVQGSELDAVALATSPAA